MPLTINDPVASKPPGYHEDEQKRQHGLGRFTKREVAGVPENRVQARHLS
jgi:hypothetical protein